MAKAKKARGYRHIKRDRIKGLTYLQHSMAGVGATAIASAAGLGPAGGANPVGEFALGTIGTMATVASLMAKKRREKHEDLLATYERVKEARRFRDQRALFARVAKAKSHKGTQAQVKDQPGTGEVKAHVRTSSKGRRYAVKAHVRKRFA